MERKAGSALHPDLPEITHVSVGGEAPPQGTGLAPERQGRCWRRGQGWETGAGGKVQELRGLACAKAGRARYLQVIDRSGRGEGCEHPVVELPPRQGLERTA